MVLPIIKEVDDIKNIFLGTIYEEIMRTHDAIIDYSRSIEINSQYAPAYYSRGI